MTIEQNIARCMEASIGAVGLTEDDWSSALGEAGSALETVRQWHKAGTLPLLHLPDKRDDVASMEQARDVLLRGARDIVFFGTGGSSLGAQAVAQFAGYRVPGAPGIQGPAGPLTFHFFDNLDGATMLTALREIDMKTCRFLVVSKSGGTPETVIQMIAGLEALKAAGLDWNASAHMVCISEPASDDKNPVRRLADRHGLMVLDHDPGVGGRYSVLSNVGMLPAMLMGLDPVQIREGAERAVKSVLDAGSAADCPAAVGAALNHALVTRSGISTVVMMPYSDRLRLFSAWFQQLWAESLGKQGKGTQPVAAAGPVDQHSQMQLFLDGPPDKLLNIIMLASAGSGPRVPEEYRSDPLIGYLANRTIGDLTDCQQRATAETYARNGRPVRTFLVDNLDEAALGQLLMHFMLETIMTGLMMKIDPFDQPAVEQSKVLTREYLATM